MAVPLGRSLCHPPVPSEKSSKETCPSGILAITLLFRFVPESWFFLEVGIEEELVFVASKRHAVISGVLALFEHVIMDKQAKPRMSLSTKVLLALVLGIATGLFFGELVAPLKVVGDAFIKLLQMTVLPYLTVSLVAGLASLTYTQALSLAKKGGLVMLFLWVVALSAVLLMPLAFPNWVSASFFSTALVREVQEFDFLNLYIPANPFNALANNTVPAVVLFSMAVGVALIGVRNKDLLNQQLHIVVEALMRVTNFVVLLAPLGVFAIAADAAGTMNVADFGRWQVYLVTYLAAWCLSILLDPSRFSHQFDTSNV